MSENPTDPPRQDAEAARVQERFERLLAAGVSIAGEHATDVVLRKVAEAARTVVGARYAALGVINEAGDELARFIVSGLSDEEQRSIGALPKGQGLLGALIRDARPMRLPSIAADARSHGFPANHPPMRSFLGVPIVARGKVFGNLYLTEKTGAAEFSEEDEHIAILLAAQAAAAIDTAQLMERQAALLSDRQALQRQRDQFHAMMNHELRNALTGVYGWAERLTRARTEEGAKLAGREVFEAAERTIMLMNNLLDLSRLDSGQVQVAMRAHQLEDIMASAIRNVLPAAETRQIKLHSDRGNAPETITTDRMKLEQVLVNLLSNAVRHSPVSEPVVMSCEATVDEVLINVSDRGAGIAEQDQHKIFEPYIRVDPESGLGSGLGLPVARRLTELMGGRLTVHSRAGRGATFTVAIPLHPPR